MKIILMFCVALFIGQLSAVPVIKEDTEFLIFDFPRDDHKSWKAITTSVTTDEKLYEFIPSNQLPGNWFELISVQYFDKRSINKTAASSIDGFIQRYQDNQTESHPKQSTTFRVIEKGQSEVIYEWILHKTENGMLPQHEIAKAFLTDNAFHKIGYTRNHRDMTPEEKNKWIKFLKENVSIKTQLEINNEVTDLKNYQPFKLGPDFKNWQLINQFPMEKGYSFESFAPPWILHGYVSECLELTAHALINKGVHKELFKLEKEQIEKNYAGKATFTIVKESDDEIVYHYICPFPKDSMVVSGVCRSVLKNGYFLMHYKKGMPFQAPKDEMNKWQKSLQTIEIHEYLKKRNS